MFGWFSGSDVEFEGFPAEGEDVSEKKLHRLEEDFSDEVIESDQLICLLVCTGGKKGGDINGHFDTQESFDDFISLLNSMGVNCFVNFDPEMTTLENLSKFYEEDEVSEELDGQIEEAELRTRIFMTKKDSYRPEFFEKLEELKKKDRPRYHRLYGKFLGMPEENIRCFIYDQRSDISKKILELFHESPPDTISDWELADRYSEKVSEEEKDDLRTFLYSMYPDKKISLEKALETAEKRRKSLEKYGIDIERYVEMFGEEAWGIQN